MIEHAWVIPFISTLAFGMILFFGTKLPKRGAEIGIFAMAASLALSLQMSVAWINGDRIPHVTQHNWFHFGGVDAKIGTITDGLTAMMLVVVGIIGLLVQVFSTGYMKHDKRYTHYFAIVTLFVAAMQWFTVSANTLQMIIGWEVMGLCSFLLIGHWWEEKRNVHAAVKAFLTTRASDAGLILGVITLFFAAGSTFAIPQLNALALSGQLSHALLYWGALGLFVAIIGKCAQFPLHTWLPDAMAGPTPISALIHAATMVVAGVYLMARLFPVFAKAFSIGDLADNFNGINPIAIIGAITIVIAAILAFVQTDIKKVLSYSTVSQLGYMVMAMGVGAWTAAVFHLFTHAFFKSLLFLASGSVSHEVGGFDIEKDMGGLRKHMPITHVTFAIGSAALVGIIPLAGFWSKEQIVAEAGANGYTAFAVVGLIGTFLTAAYMVRCYYGVFWGKYRGNQTPHDPSPSLTIPCIILAVLSVVAGWLQAPAFGITYFEDWVTPEYLKLSSDNASIVAPFSIELGLVTAGIATALIAIMFGFGPRMLAERSRIANAFHTFLLNRYYLDWLYDKIFVQGIRRGLAVLVREIDANVVDGAVREVSAATNSSAAALSVAHNGRVQRYAGLMFATVAIVGVILVVTL